MCLDDQNKNKSRNKLDCRVPKDDQEQSTARKWQNNIKNKITKVQELIEELACVCMCVKHAYNERKREIIPLNG